MAKTAERRKRDWPLLIVTRGDVVHISRFNSPHSMVYTDCGRDINYVGSYSGKLEHLESADGRTVTGILGCETYKLCSRCGKKEDFITAFKEHAELHEKFMARMRQKEEFIREEILRESEDLTDHVRYVIRKVRGIDDVTSEDFCVQFNMTLPNGEEILMQLSPANDEKVRYMEDIRLRAADKFEEINGKEMNNG